MTAPRPGPEAHAEPGVPPQRAQAADGPVPPAADHAMPVVGDRPVGRQSGFVILNSVAGALQGYLALFVIARYMVDGDEVLGGRAIALTLVALAGTIARLGLPTTHVRRLARGEDVAASTGTYMALKSALTALFMLVAGAALYLWFEVLDRSVTDTTPTALWLAYAIVVVQSLRDIPVNSFQGLRRIAEREAVLFTNTISTVLLTVWVGVAVAGATGRWMPFPALGEWAASTLAIPADVAVPAIVDLLMTAILVGECAALLLAFGLFVWRRIPVARPRRDLATAYLRFTVPLMFLAVGEVATKWLSQGMLWVWWDAAEVGQYAAGAKFSEVLLLLGTGMAIVLLPAMSALHHRGDRAGALRLVHDAERWSSLILWPATMATLLLSGAVVHVLLSDQFARATVPLALLAVQALVTCLVLPVQSFAIATGRTRFAARVVMTVLAADVAFGLVLIPRHLGPLPMAGLGATGAALATLAATMLAVGLFRMPKGDWPGHRFLRRTLAKHALAALAAGTAFVLLPLPVPDRFYSLGLQALLLLGLYVAGLLAMGELRRSDWQTIRRLLRSTP